MAFARAWPRSRGGLSFRGAAPADARSCRPRPRTSPRGTPWRHSRRAPSFSACGKAANGSPRLSSCKVLRGRPAKPMARVSVLPFRASLSRRIARSGKRRGKAVDRNRARRRLREAVRLTFVAHAETGFDYVIIGRASALTRNFADLLADMRLAFHKVSQPARSDKDRNPVL